MNSVRDSAMMLTNFSVPAITKMNLAELLSQMIDPQFNSIKREWLERLRELPSLRNLTVYCIRYPYGQVIFQNKQLLVPTKSGKYLPLAATDLKNLHHDLNYGGDLPLFFPLNRTLEAVLDTKARALPLRVYYPGELSGLYSMFDLQQSTLPQLKLYAGARTIYSLPRIGENISHNRMQKVLGIKAATPRGYADQWQVFTKIANSNYFNDHWQATVVFFSREILDCREQLLRQPFFQNWFMCYLQQGAYWQSEHLMQAMLTEMNVMMNRYFDVHFIATLRHLFSIAAGALPGLCFAHDELSAPIAALKHVYQDLYGLREYGSNFLLGAMLPKQSTLTAYYSLGVPGLLEEWRRPKRLATQRMELIYLKEVLQEFLAYINRPQCEWQTSAVAHWLLNYDYTCFHSEADLDDTILSTEMLVHGNSDPILTALQQATLGKRLSFCYPSALLKGIIQIKQRQSADQDQGD